MKLDKKEPTLKQCPTMAVAAIILTISFIVCKTKIFGSYETNGGVL